MGSRLKFITPVFVSAAVAAALVAAPTAVTSHIVLAGNGSGLHGGGALP
jgi:hypothetical protein